MRVLQSTWQRWRLTYLAQSEEEAENQERQVEQTALQARTSLGSSRCSRMEEKGTGWERGSSVQLGELAISLWFCL